MSYDYKALETNLVELVESINSFSNSEVSEVKQFIFSGEYGIAFESLCSIVKEQNKFLSDHNRSTIQDLANRMNIEPIWWRELIEKV